MFIQALSLTQPWATLWAAGAKKYETRSWGTKHRGLLAIQAASGFPPEARARFTQAPFFRVLQELGFLCPAPPPLGAVVALTTLVDCAQVAEVALQFAPGGRALTGVLIHLARGTTWTISPQEYAFGDFRPGRWLWVPGAVYRLPTPLRASGRHRLWLWECPDRVLAASGLAVPAEALR